MHFRTTWPESKRSANTATSQQNPKSRFVDRHVVGTLSKEQAGGSGEGTQPTNTRIKSANVKHSQSGGDVGVSGPSQSQILERRCPDGVEVLGRVLVLQVCLGGYLEVGGSEVLLIFRHRQSCPDVPPCSPLQSALTACQHSSFHICHPRSFLGNEKT